MWKPRMTNKEAAAQKKLETDAKELFNTRYSLQIHSRCVDFIN